MGLKRFRLTEEALKAALLAFSASRSPYPLVKIAAAVSAAYQHLEAWRIVEKPQEGEVVLGAAYYRRTGDKWEIYDREVNDWVATEVPPIYWKNDINVVKYRD